MTMSLQWKAWLLALLQSLCSKQAQISWARKSTAITIALNPSQGTQVRRKFCLRLCLGSNTNGWKNRLKTWMCGHKIYDPYWLLPVRERNHRSAAPQMFSIRSSWLAHFLLNVFTSYFVSNNHILGLSLLSYQSPSPYSPLDQSRPTPWKWLWMCFAMITNCSRVSYHYCLLYKFLLFKHIVLSDVY